MVSLACAGSPHALSTTSSYPSQRNPFGSTNKVGTARIPQHIFQPPPGTARIEGNLSHRHRFRPLFRSPFDLCCNSECICPGRFRYLNSTVIHSTRLLLDLEPYKPWTSRLQIWAETVEEFLDHAIIAEGRFVVLAGCMVSILCMMVYRPNELEGEKYTIVGSISTVISLPRDERVAA